ncbi:MAG: cyclic lactone autoinducer peptide [Bacillota bacterium]|nr:cyclic lactone autoinducer peptide [Bacillota bacterium]
MRRYIFLVLATLLTWLAAANVAFACGGHWYEPEVPLELR